MTTCVQKDYLYATVSFIWNNSNVAILPLVYAPRLPINCIKHSHHSYNISGNISRNSLLDLPLQYYGNMTIISWSTKSMFLNLHLTHSLQSVTKQLLSYCCMFLTNVYAQKSEATITCIESQIKTAIAVNNSRVSTPSPFTMSAPPPMICWIEKITFTITRHCSTYTVHVF